MPALLSLWNGIDPARADEYERWHTLEHVPERVWVPGFVSGTRYVRHEADGPRFFTLYEIDDPACLDGDAYRDLVDKPTPWSASMRPSFTGFVRKTGPVLAQAGVSSGRAIAIARLVWTGEADPTAAADWRGCAQAVLGRGVDTVVTRVRVQRAVPAGPQAMRNEDAAPAGTEVLLLIETASAAAHPALLHVAPALADAGIAAPDWREDSCFGFVTQVRHADVARPGRPAPRLDLMPRR